MHPRITRLLARGTRRLGLGPLLNVPKGFTGTREWISSNSGNSGNSANYGNPGAAYIPLLPATEIREKPPVVIGHHVSGRFTRHYQRHTNEAFVAVIPKGRIFGEFSNMVISPDNYILGDLSREFGAEGGRKPHDFSIFYNRLRMPPKRSMPGKTAVISTCGSNNFHHWNYDVLPRLHLLRKAGLLEEMDHLVINYRQTPFQLAGLDLLGIDRSKIINCGDDPDFYLETEMLYAPSLPEDLGTISPWVVDFLRDSFLPQPGTPASSGAPASPGAPAPKKLFISRRNAPSRRIINEKDVMREILGRGYEEFIPEDHSFKETAAFFAAATSLVSVHGSGFSNLPFISAGTKVLDIMAPYHQDPYYWMICNIRNAMYVALFSEGEHPPDDFDIVKRKIDDDLLIDINKLKIALDMIS